jgi:hypothetical protein
MEVVIAFFLFVILIIWAFVRRSPVDFSRMGDLRGKSLQEIIQIVGKPKSISSAGPGELLVQWIEPGVLHVALAFRYMGPIQSFSGKVDNHLADYICLGVTHQYSRFGV